MLDYIIVGVGGMLGAAARLYSYRLLGGNVDTVIASISEAGAARVLMLPTLWVNLLACLIIGVVIQPLSGKPGLLLFAVTGFLGAFSTFSTFGFELFRLLGDGLFVAAAIYILASLIAGIFFAGAGWWLSSLLVR